MAGFTEAQRQRIAADRRRATSRAGSAALLERLAALGAGDQATTVEPSEADLGDHG